MGREHFATSEEWYAAMEKEGFYYFSPDGIGECLTVPQGGDYHLIATDIPVPGFELVTIPVTRDEVEIPNDAHVIDHGPLQGYLFWHEGQGPDDPIEQGLVWVVQILGRDLVFHSSARDFIDDLRDRGATPIDGEVKSIQVHFTDDPLHYVVMDGAMVAFYGAWLDYHYGKWMWDHQAGNPYYKPWPSDKERFDGWVAKTRKDDLAIDSLL